MEDTARRPLSGRMHLAAALAAVVGAVVLILTGGPNPVKMVALAVYGLSLILLLGSSAAVCSSSSRRLGFSQVAISSVKA